MPKHRKPVRQREEVSLTTEKHSRQTQGRKESNKLQPKPWHFICPAKVSLGAWASNACPYSMHTSEGQVTVHKAIKDVVDFRLWCHSETQPRQISLGEAKVSAHSVNTADAGEPWMINGWRIEMGTSHTPGKLRGGKNVEKRETQVGAQKLSMLVVLIFVSDSIPIGNSSGWCQNRRSRPCS